MWFHDIALDTMSAKFILTISSPMAVPVSLSQSDIDCRLKLQLIIIFSSVIYSPAQYYALAI